MTHFYGFMKLIIIILGKQVSMNTNNLNTVISYHVFLSNTSNCQTNKFNP